MCFSPLVAWKRKGGGVTFNKRDAISPSPFELSCGQCRECRAQRARAWSLRIMHEASSHWRKPSAAELAAGVAAGSDISNNSFLTLTYDPLKLPSDGGLHVEHFQKFCKRLRKRVGPFRFFHCGEYGEENLRPHYHACIFGYDFSRDRVVFKPNGFNTLYTSKLLEDTWSLGFCTIGALTRESAEYVARYVMKKMTGEKAELEYLRVDTNTGEVWDVRPPYCTMSRRPGIGSAWFDKYRSDVYPEDEIVYDGKRFRPPRYYDTKLAEEELRKYKEKRIASYSVKDAGVRARERVVREEVLRTRDELFGNKRDM